jgi:NADH-quinone oxidoreductase subunit G
MRQACPTLTEAERVSPAPWGSFGEPGPVAADAFEYPIEDFYRTDPISRASRTMAQCSELFVARSREAQGRTGTHG